MSAEVVDFVALQVRPHIEATRSIRPLIRDVDIERLLVSGRTVLGVKAELFRMVTLDPAWIAEALAQDEQEFGSLSWGEPEAGATILDGVNVAPSTSRRSVSGAATVLDHPDDHNTAGGCSC